MWVEGTSARPLAGFCSVSTPNFVCVCGGGGDGWWLGGEDVVSVCVFYHINTACFYHTVLLLM